jgi:hypothetical protein
MKLWLLFACCAWSFFAISVPALENPRLSITNAQGEFIVSWPSTATDWVLEQSGDLRPSVPWTRVSSDLYQSNALSRYLRISALSGSRFFRLRKGPSMPGLNVPGLTGYWQLDEGAGQNSEEGIGSGTAMFLANTVWERGRIGPGALRFNGAAVGAGGSRAWVSNANYRVLPSFGQPFSVSLWFCPDALTIGWRALVGNDANGSSGWHVALHTSGPGTNYLVFAGTGAASSLSVTGRTLLLPGQWHQLTITHNGTEGSIYLDSALLGRGIGNVLTHAGPLYFGGGAGNYDSFWGRIDDVRTYTNALTHEQISLTGHWRFDENAGAFAKDSSIQGHHASLLDPAAWVPGRDGSGIGLSMSEVTIRNEDYVVLPATGGSFSLSFWLRPSGLPLGRSGLMSCGTTNDGWQMAVEVEGLGKTWLHFASTNSGGTLALRASLPLTNGVWTKVDATYNGGIATVYANARKVETQSGAIRGSRAPLMVGVAPNLANFAGAIDELRIYNRERDPAEIGPVAQTMWETVFLNSTTNLTLQGFGPAGKPLTYSIVPILTPTNGTVANTGGSPIATYTSGTRKGPDAFAYTVSDGEFTSDPAIVTVSVVEPHWLSLSGGAGGTRDGSSPARAWVASPASALDAIWKTNNYYDCFFYAPGEYETSGSKYRERITENPGCKHIGSGSSGVSQTKLKLVGSLEHWDEEFIFAPLHGGAYCDGFEVHHMILDCNAVNLPKFIRGEPVWFRIPLATTQRVETVTLRWANKPSLVPNWRLGRPIEFSVCTRRFADNAYSTNCTMFTSTGQVDVVTIGAQADELLVRLDRRAAGVDFYSLAEVELAGGVMSLATATIPGGGESRLDSQHSILRAVDEIPSSAWASGPENQVQITLPLAAGTSLSQLNLHWNCKTLENGIRLGPAAEYSIRARDENSGQYYEVPFVRHVQTAEGWETNTFGTIQSTNTIVTDQLQILLTSREPMVGYYSLRELTLQNGLAPVMMRLPTADSSFTWGDYSILRAFDKDSDTQWASDTQGMIGAIFAVGNNMKFTHLKVVGFGTKAGRECFPFFHQVYPGPGNETMHHGNVLIEDCLITEPAPNNRDGVTALGLFTSHPNTVTNAVVRRCTITGLRSHFRYSNGVFANHAENCLVQDCGSGSYFEPSPVLVVGSVLIRSNQFINVDYGVPLVAYSSEQLGSVTCLNNEILLNGVGGWGIGFLDTAVAGRGSSVTNMTALNNIIRYADWVPRPTYPDRGVFYSDIHNAVFGNNVVVLGTASALRVRQCPDGWPLELEADCNGQKPDILGPPPCIDTLLPGYRRAWFNNRNLSGTLLDVRFSNNGIDGLSSQQQWQE